MEKAEDSDSIIITLEDSKSGELSSFTLRKSTVSEFVNLLEFLTNSIDLNNDSSSEEPDVQNANPSESSVQSIPCVSGGEVNFSKSLMDVFYSYLDKKTHQESIARHQQSNFAPSMITSQMSTMSASDLLKIRDLNKGSH